MTESPHVRDGTSLLGKPCVPRHDAHVAMVDGSERAPKPMSRAKWEGAGALLYSELVVFEKSHILPLCIMRFS